MAVRINRSERQVPFLSNKVPGSAVQVTPNGTARDQDGTEGEPTGAMVGAEPSKYLPAPMPEPESWSGNRSGE